LLIRSDNTEPVTNLVLLQELLGKVLEVTFGESNVGNNSDLVISGTRDGNSFTEVVGTTINLDTIMKVLFLLSGKNVSNQAIRKNRKKRTYKGSGIKDLVVSRSRTVNNELRLLDSRGGGLDGSHF
jgi:hypothetical protein